MGAIEEFADDFGLKPGELMQKSTDDEAYSRYQAAQEAAAAKGLVIVEPTARELFVDIDDAASLAVFDRLIEKVVEMLPGTTWESWPSPGEKPDHHHVVVTLPRDLRDPFERVMLQAILGSDRMREVLSWQRATRGDPRPTLFFERPTPKLEVP